MSDDQSPQPGSMDAVRRGLRHLTDFTGRDTRAEFWPYALAVTVGYIIVGNIVGLVVMALTVLPLDGRDPEDFSIWPFFVTSATAGAVVAGLFAAAVTRRLHDRGHRGAWAGVPLALAAIALALMGVLFRDLEAFEQDADPTMFFVGFAANLAYFAAMAVLILQLALPGGPDDNRYGPGTARQ